MGAAIAWLVKALQFGGPAALGFLFSDLIDWISGLIPQFDQKDARGNPVWWVILVVAAAGGLVIYIIVSTVAGLAGAKGKKFLVTSWMGVIAISLYFFFPGDESTIYAELLGTVAAATTGTIRSQYCPGYITFVRATVPTSFVITVTGDGEIFNLDGAGLDNLNGQGAVGALQANGYIFQIADGWIGKNTNFTIANAAGAVLSVYGFSDAAGAFYNVHAQAQALAGQSLPLDDFYYLAFPNAAVGDRWTVTFEDGTTAQFTDRLELENYLVYKQEVTATRFNLDNYEGVIKSVQFVGALTQAVYWCSQREARGTVQQNI